MLFALGLLWTVTDILHSPFEERKPFEGFQMWFQELITTVFYFFSEFFSLLQHLKLQAYSTWQPHA
jgi:hypothetical protein